MKTIYCLFSFILSATPSLFCQNPPIDQVPTPPEYLGHLECQIRADTDCVNQTVTLEAWIYYTFSGLELPITAPWSTGDTVHKIIVTPPGAWSWDVENIGCEPVHQFNTISLDGTFFTDTLAIIGESATCPFENIAITVNTAGYDQISDFVWQPPFSGLSPYPIQAPGTYALTITDAYGCTFSDAVLFENLPPNGFSCEESCVVCDIDGLLGDNNIVPSGGNSGCPGIAVHNDLWYGFVAGTTAITMDIVTSNCQNGDGLQAAFWSDCADPEALACNGGCGGCGNLPITLSYSNFTPGETYYLMIDGWVNDICDFEIVVTDGSTIAPSPTQPLQPIGPSQVCPGVTAIYTIPDAIGAGNYHWIAPPDASINGLSNNETIDAPQGTYVSITFGDSSGTVCVQSGNACEPSSGMSCLDIVSSHLAPTIKPPLVRCFEDLPFTWDEEPFPVLDSAGIYNLSSVAYPSYVGCDSVVKQTVTIRGPIISTLPNQYICKGDCLDINGASFCDPGIYNIIFESYTGCDSVVQFTLNVLDPVAGIIGESYFICEQDSLLLSSLPSIGIKEWRDTSGQLLGTGDSLWIHQAGIYILLTTINDGGIQCIRSESISVSTEATLIDVQIMNEQNTCEADALLLTCTTSVANPIFEWSGPGGFSSSEQNPQITAQGIYSVMVTTAAGCVGTASTAVDMIGGAPAVLVPDAIIVCTTFPQLTALTSASNPLYSWMYPDSSFSSLASPLATIPGTYSVVVTDSINGCTASAEAMVSEQFPFFEIASATVIHPTVGMNNGSIDIAIAGGTGPFTFSWFYDGLPFSDMEDVNNLSPGNYVVAVTDTFGCITMDTFELSAVSGIYDVAGISNWDIRPNPSGGQFEICCNSIDKQVSRLLVYDYGGRLVLDQQVPEPEKTILLDLKSSPSGVYFLEMLEPDRSVWLKLVVQR